MQLFNIYMVEDGKGLFNNKFVNCIKKKLYIQTETLKAQT